MRITTNYLSQRITADIQRDLATMADAQQKVSTGHRFEQVAEDPLSAVQVMGADRSLRALDQYRKNTAAARTRSDSEEAVLNQLTDLLTRAKEIGIEEGSASASTSTRQTAATEVDQILQQVISLGNTKVGNEYLFAGNQSLTQPFDSAGLYYGDQGTRQAEVGENYLVTTNHNGQQLLVGSAVLSSLQALKTELTSGTSSSISGTLTGLGTAYDSVQSMLAETGGRSRQMDSASQNSDALTSSLTLRKSDYQDVPVEQASTRFVTAQSTLQAALLSASRMLSTNLSDYLK